MEDYLKDWLKYDITCVKGYTRLSDCPEVLSAVDRIAELISSMTIHLMENTDDGDRRIRDALSKKIDINPYSKTTRQVFIHWIVKNLLINGSVVVYPKTKKGYLDDLIPIADSRWVYDSLNQRIFVDGKAQKLEDVLYFILNPSERDVLIGDGYRVALQDILKNLRQANKTTNDFMTNKMLPSVIVKVDAVTEQFKSFEGREEIEDQFLSNTEAGRPWIVPAELIDVQQVKPLTLRDIAIAETVELDKRTVAAMLGIPSFLLGVGDFNKDEYNNFIRTRIMGIAKGIEQELTKKLLFSPERFFKFNYRSLFAYDIMELANMGGDLFTKGILTGNEVRDLLGFNPREGLNDLIILENYIKLDDIEKQKKLGGDKDEK